MCVVLIRALLIAAIARESTYAQDATDRAIVPAPILEAAQERVNADWYPSLVIAFVEGGKSEVATFGKLDNGKTPDSRTVYEIGSITKTFTAALLAQAILSGRVKLDDPVTQLLPGWRVPSRSGKSISLENLATQSSGLPYMPANLVPVDHANPFAGYDATKLQAFLTGYELTRDPGEAYEYSNLGFGLLGFSLSQPQSYKSVIEKQILQPLNMRMTGLGLNGVRKAHLAPGHDRHNQPTENWSFDALAGCGAIDSTGADMLRYLQANMGIGKTALSSAFHLAQQARRDMDKTDRIGFAWMTRKATPQDVIWHNGTTFGYASFIGFTADRQRGIVILTNVSETVDDLGFAALSDSSLRAYKTVPLDQATLISYVGLYKESNGGLIRVILRKAQLYAQALGEEPLPLFPQAPGEFFTRINGFHLIFRRESNGEIGSLILRQTTDRIASKLHGDKAASALARFHIDSPANAAFTSQ